MDSHMVGPDPDARKVRLCLVVAIVLVGLLLLAGVGRADAAPETGGACVGYTDAQGTVVAFQRGVFANTLTVRVGNVYGSRYTLEHWTVGQRVLVTGIACNGSLGIQFRVRRG